MDNKTANKPEYLKSGEPARLFPVLSSSSKEANATSILLACLSHIDQFGERMFSSIGQNIGKRAKTRTFTEVVFKNHTSNKLDRPDGLIIINTGKREWKALVEVKIGNKDLDYTQIERYRNLAKDLSIDCVISISNQFTSSPFNHPIETVRKKKSKVAIYHWSWMFILTQIDLLCRGGTVDNLEQKFLLNELRLYLTHESAGVKGFERMPKEWVNLCQQITRDGIIPAKSKDAETVIDAWHQETRDLSLILSRMAETIVAEKLPPTHKRDPATRRNHDLKQLKETKRLMSVLEIPDAAAPLELVADMGLRTIEVGMTLKSPEDRKSTKARLNWLLRQIDPDISDVYIRFIWPRRAETNSELVSKLRAEPELGISENKHLVARAFQVFITQRLGARFTKPVIFIACLEKLVPHFYGTIGANLSAWKRPAPKLAPNRTLTENVSTRAIEEDASNNQN